LPGAPASGDHRLTMVERRIRRSHVRDEALLLFLDSQREALGSRGLSVATIDGRVLASVGTKTKPGSRVGTWQLSAAGMDLVVTSHGGRLSHDLGTGVKRILGA
jgi:hypothetical protein